MVDYSDAIFERKNAEKRLIELLTTLAEIVGAQFVQLFFAKDSDGHFTHSYHAPKNHFPVSEISDFIKVLAETEIPDNRLQVIDRETISTKNTNRISLPFEQLILIPVAAPPDQTAVIVMGFFSTTSIDSADFKELIDEIKFILLELNIHEINCQNADRDDFLLSLSHALTTVNNRKQLVYLIDGKVGPFLGFSASAIFLLDCNKGTINNFFYDPEIMPDPNLFSQSVSVEKLPMDDYVIEAASTITNTGAYDFEELSETKDITPYLRVEWDLEEKDGFLMNINSGDEVIGHWIFLFNSKGIFSQQQLNVYHQVINLITIALLKIKALEEIKKKEKVTETIQSINIDLASTKEKKDLLTVIHHKLKKLFDFGHHSIAVINEDEFTMSLLLEDSEANYRYHSRYKFITHAKFPINDQVLNKVLLSKDPIIFDLDMLSYRGNMPDYMVINYESGIRKIVMVSLQVGTRIFGIWAICLLENQYLNPYQLELIKGLSHQLSIAAHNIQASQVILNKNNEREILSQINSDITSIRKREDLHPLLDRTLRNWFGFDQAIIMVGHNNETYQLFLSANEKNTDLNDKHYPCQDGIFDKVVNSPGVVVLNMDLLIKEKLVPDYIIAEYKQGVRQKLAVRLRTDHNNIGVIFFNGWKNASYSEHELDLINGISFQLSIAVSNVLANEEITRKENERELLLSLSTELASVRNRNQLLVIITRKLKAALGFSHIAIGILDEDGNSMRAYLSDPGSKSRNHPIYQSVSSDKIQTNDGVINTILESAFALSFDFGDISKDQELPEYFRMNIESGINQAIAIRFSKDGKAFGVMFIFYERRVNPDRNYLALIKGLGDQISVAVSNILANHNIELREIEKSKLLNFSNELASERNILTISKILKKQLKALFSIGDFLAVSVLSEDKKSHQIIIYDPDAPISSDPYFIHVTQNYVPLHKDIFGVILNSEGPVLFDVKDWVNMETAPVYAELLPKYNIDNMIGAVIRFREEPIGFLVFQQDSLLPISRQPQLFNSICSQLSIILSNILANQKVDSQLRQIKQYKEQLEDEKTYLTEEIQTIHNYTEIIGGSLSLRDTFKLVSKVAASDSTVLILGETGTGKELIARAVHNNSPRKGKLMVKVNCAALPTNLIESELFGHERGSFTGAIERRLGKFELANGGTLFLDEIGEMPLDLQVKLLRALQEREIERVGGKNTIKVDVRIIAATNRNLEKEIEEGRFRSDLYYRLNIFPITLPPLRERKDDISLLATHFINKFSKKTGNNIDSLSKKVLEDLREYAWPGNIRELEHLIERSVLLASGNTIKQVFLPSPKQQNSKVTPEQILLHTIDENEKDHIFKILKYCKGRISGEGGAAEILGVPPTTLNSKIKRLGIKREHAI